MVENSDVDVIVIMSDAFPVVESDDMLPNLTLKSKIIEITLNTRKRMRENTVI